MGAWWWLFDWRERVWVPGVGWTTATVSAGAEEEEEELVSWPLLERAGEEREEDLEGRMSPGLGVLRVRVLESKPEEKEGDVRRRERRRRELVSEDQKKVQ